MHYHATRRDDSPFWDHVRTMEVPDTLLEKMELFRRRGRVAKYRQGVFLEPSWLAVYIGQGIIPEAYDPRVDAPVEPLARAVDGLRAQIRATAAAMPAHDQYLARYCPMRQAA